MTRSTANRRDPARPVAAAAARPRLGTRLRAGCSRWPERPTSLIEWAGASPAVSAAARVRGDTAARLPGKAIPADARVRGRVPAGARTCAVARVGRSAGAQVRICARRPSGRDAGCVVSARVVAVLNRKGGAGKTSLTKDVGFPLTELGVRVLQIGLDPQCSLEVLAGLGFDTPPDRTASRLLMPEEFGDTPPLEAVMHQTRWGTWLVPASKLLASAERALGDPAAAAPTSGSSAALTASTSPSGSGWC
jgi:AAA domain